ncbi:hypothetical protein QUO89_003144, partial [Enterococcus faecalis]|nr:hypothetical protein [Enterococcus faecalis]
MLVFTSCKEKKLKFAIKKKKGGGGAASFIIGCLIFGSVFLNSTIATASSIENSYAISSFGNQTKGGYFLYNKGVKTESVIDNQVAFCFDKKIIAKLNDRGFSTPGYQLYNEKDEQLLKVYSNEKIDKVRNIMAYAWDNFITKYPYLNTYTAASNDDRASLARGISHAIWVTLGQTTEKKSRSDLGGVNTNAYKFYKEALNYKPLANDIKNYDISLLIPTDDNNILQINASQTLITVKKIDPETPVTPENPDPETPVTPENPDPEKPVNPDPEKPV